MARHPDVTLAGVWARREAAARALAAAHDTQAYTDLDEMFGQVDAVAFAVPPAAQAELGVRAARSGKHVVLEKPIASDVAGAEGLTEAITAARVASLVMLTLRYADYTRTWLAEIDAAGEFSGGGARWLSGALLGQTYRDSAWRHEQGALADIGPHAIDLLDASLGEVTEVLAAHRTDEDLWQLVLAHAGGATSTVTLSLRVPLDPTIAEFVVYGEQGYRVLNRRPGSAATCYAALLDEFVAMVTSGTRQALYDVRRGLHLQRILSSAAALATR